jgi:hypothetical protein
LPFFHSSNHLKVTVVTPDQIEQKLSTQEPWVTDAINDIRAMIHSDFSDLTQIYKWNAVMWVSEENLIAGVVPIKNGLKFCLFVKLTDGKQASGLNMQRWGTKHVSQNLLLLNYGTEEQKTIRHLLLSASR